MDFRFTLSHNNNGAVTSQQISQPDGWKNAKIKLIRHEDFCSLIEYYEGDASGAFNFYGSDGNGLDGGIEFIKDIEQNFGFDATIDFEAEFSIDDVNFEVLFTGQLDLSEKNEMPDNRMQVPVIRDDFWAKFINRMDTPVDLSSTTDIDGNPVNPVTPITINLTCQKIRKKYVGRRNFGELTEYSIPASEYGQIDFPKDELNEIAEKKNLPEIDNPEIPAALFELEEDGSYTFDILIQTSTEELLGSSLTGISAFIKINDNAPITFTGNNFGTNGIDGGSRFSYSATHELKKGDQIRFYFENTSGVTKEFIVFGDVDDDDPDNPLLNSWMKVTADTTYPETDAEGYLIHDLIFGVLQRIGLGNDPLRSDFLGGLLTNTKAYGEDGCGWMYAAVKGLQIRNYTLEEKPFFISFKQIWSGINPILNLGLGYENNTSSPGGMQIRIEQKEHFYETGISVNIANVRDISSSYDPNYIFKTIKTGYKKWQSEDLSGIDDTQTTHTYATRFIRTGKDLNLESDFIAASLAVEVTRRKTKEKNADYKFDNDTFIIALKENDLSPDRYSPELNENFNNIENLINLDTRYNLILTPMRNLLRWANYLGGCLQSYTSSAYKFVSGEGNYNMVSDYACGSGNLCQAIICDPLTESDDISLGAPSNYNSVFGYLHLPLEYNFTVPLEWEDFVTIRDNPKKAIGVSMTDENFKTFILKQVDYNIVLGQATIAAWPREYFNIQVIQGDYTAPGCPVERTISTSDDAASGPGDYDVDYQAILDHAIVQGYSLPSDEQQALQNQLLLDLKSAGIWDDLDLLYVFATDGDRNFAKINWKSPGNFTASEVDTPTFTSSHGFTGNGSSSYLNTGWAPDPDGVNYTQDEAGIFGYSGTEITAGTKYLVGAIGNSGGATNGNIQLVPKQTTQHSYAVNSTGTVVGTSVSSIGFFHIRRVTSNDQRLFKDGAQVGSANVGASTSISDNSVYILARNNEGTADSFSDGRVGIAGIGASLTGKESDLYNAWNDYFTNL